MAFHTPPLKKAKKLPLPSLVQSIPKFYIFKWMELSLGNGISPWFFAFLRGGV